MALSQESLRNHSRPARGCQFVSVLTLTRKRGWGRPGWVPSTLFTSGRKQNPVLPATLQIHSKLLPHLLLSLCQTLPGCKRHPNWERKVNVRRILEASRKPAGVQTLTANSKRRLSAPTRRLSQSFEIVGMKLVVSLQIVFVLSLARVVSSVNRSSLAEGEQDRAGTLLPAVFIMTGEVRPTSE